MQSKTVSHSPYSVCCAFVQLIWTLTYHVSCQHIRINLLRQQRVAEKCFVLLPKMKHKSSTILNMSSKVKVNSQAKAGAFSYVRPWELARVETLHDGWILLPQILWSPQQPWKQHFQLPFEEDSSGSRLTKIMKEEKERNINFLKVLLATGG